MYQANAAHSGYIPATFDPAGFTLKWTVQLSSEEREVNPVVAANGKVYASLRVYFNEIDQFFALSAINGSTLWSKDYGDVFSVNPPAVDGNTVYIQVGNHTPETRIYGYNVANGSLLYEEPFAAQWERYYSPTILHGRVYIDGGYYGGMYCFDFRDPEPTKWFIGLNQYDEWTPAVDGSYAYAYTGEYNPELSIIDISNGEEIWSIPDPNFDWDGWSMEIAPVLGGRQDVIVIDDGSGRLISFNLATVDIRYEIADGFAGQPNVRHNVIYAFNNNTLEARDQMTGALMWSWDPNEDNLYLRDTMIVTDTHVLLHALNTSDHPYEHTTRAISLTTHEETWSYPVGGRLAFAESVLYIARDDGYLTALQSGPVQLDAQLQLSASAYSALENSGSVVVSVNRTTGFDGAVGVTISTANGTAIAGDDYVATSQVLTWADGDSSTKNVALTLLDDALEEQPETFTVSLSDPTGDAGLGTTTTATVTIIDDETSTLQFSPSSYSVSEDGGSVNVVVTRVGGTNGTVGVTATAVNGTAASGSDFEPYSEVLEWGLGDSTTRQLTIVINDDAIEEGPEYFSLELTNPTGPAYLGFADTADITVVDDDLVEVPTTGTTVSAQSSAAVDSNASGSTIVVWQSYEQDGSGWGVYGRRIDSGGNPVGSEFRVNQATTGNQKNADVAVDDDGSFVVVWESDTGDGSGSGVYGRCFSSAGIAEGNAFRVNTTTALDQSMPVVGMDVNGRFLVVYQTSNNPGGEGENILARGYGPDCSALGAEFEVSTAANDQALPDVAANGANSFVVVWQSNGQDGPAEGIMTRRFNGAGSPLSSESVVNEFTSGNQEDPAVDCAANGRCLVVWQDPNHRDGWGYSIQARKLNAAGSPFGSDFQVNTYYESNQTDPAIAVNQDGETIIAWESDGQDGSGAGVFAQLLTIGGAFVGDEFRANLFIWSSQRDPAVAHANFSAFLSWTSGYQDGDSDGVYSRFVVTGDGIFKDGFEGGGAGAWSSAVGFD